MNGKTSRLDRVPPYALRCLAALLDCRAAGELPTYRRLAGMIGWRSSNAVGRAVLRLRLSGLVEWDRDLAATLRPTVRFIPAERR